MPAPLVFMRGFRFSETAETPEIRCLFSDRAESAESTETRAFQPGRALIQFSSVLNR
jgi:hypothetical protein